MKKQHPKVCRKVIKNIQKLPQNGSYNFPDFPGGRPHSDPEGHTAAQDRPKSPPGTDKGFLGDPGDPKGAPKTPKKAPKGPPNEPQATPSAALGPPNAPKRHLKRPPTVPTLEKKINTTASEPAASPTQLSNSTASKTISARRNARSA